jgi:hypothetical protein
MSYSRYSEVEIMTYDSIKVKKSDIADILKLSFPDYTGRKFTVVFRCEIQMYNTNWSDGSKNDYVVLDFNKNHGNAYVDNMPAPWVNPYENSKIQLTKNKIVVEHMFFCGKDAGITIYAHPDNAIQLLGSTKLNIIDNTQYDFEVSNKDIIRE